MSEITSDYDRTVDELTEIVMSKYQDDLKARETELNAQTDAVHNDVDKLAEDVAGRVDRNKYVVNEVNAGALGITSEVTDVYVDWDNERVVLTVMLTDLDAEEHHGVSTFGKHRSEPIEDAVAKLRYSQLREALDTLTTAKTDVYSALNSLGDKRRQVRAKISEVRLRAQGLADSLDHEEVRALVTVG